MFIQHKLPNPLKNWQVNRDQIGFMGQDLQRLECIFMGDSFA
jgi:gluconolactonase